MQEKAKIADALCLSAQPLKRIDISDDSDIAKAFDRVSFSLKKLSDEMSAVLVPAALRAADAIKTINKEAEYYAPIETEYTIK